MQEILFYRGLKRKYNKAIHQDVVYFATDTKEIIVNDVSYGSVDVDTELTEIGQNPVIGSAIYKAIKDNINSAVEGASFGSSLQLINIGTNAYQIALLDKKGNIISQTTTIVGDQSGTADLSGLSFTISGNQHIQTKLGETSLLSYIFDIYDATGSSLGLNGTIKVYKDTFPTEDSVPIIEKTVTPGQGNVDVTNYLTEGAVTNFWITASAEGQKEVTVYYTVRLINLSITSNYALNTITNIGEDVIISGTITGTMGTKVIEAYVNGIIVADDEVGSTTGNWQLAIPTSEMSHGSCSVQVRAKYEIYDDFGVYQTTVYSNIIYLDTIVVDSVNTTPVFACRFDYKNGDSLITGTPIIEAKQYSLFNLSYFVYDKNASREVTFYSENVAIGSNSFSDAVSNIKYRYTTNGLKICYFECNGVVYDFAVNVSKSDYLIDEPTSSLSLYLDALGKSNSSATKDSWTYKDVTTSFENFNWSGNGWTGNSLKLFNGAKATIHHQPFKAAGSGALAFTIRFKVSNATNPDEVIVSCVDSYGYGVTITAQEAKLKTTTSEVSTKFASDQTYTIGFVSFPEANENSSQYGINNSKMCYIYVDGVISGGITKNVANEIYQIDPQDITLQATNCELEVYSIRAYSTELTDDQMLNCHLIDLVDGEAINTEYEQNDVLDLNGEITVEKVHGKLPYFIVTGASSTEGLSQFEYAAIQNNKDDKYNVDSILYVDTNPEFNFLSIPAQKNPQIRLQGTSSMGYPRKNYRIYIKDASIYLGCDKDGNGGTLQEKPKYSMSSTAAPVNCWCLKADFAESSSSHNTGTTGLVEEVLAKANQLTPAQKYVNTEEYPYQVRTTVEGKPCLLFYRSSVNETPKFGGKFNFNNDKSTEEVFGFLDIPGYNDSFTEDMLKSTNDSLVWGDFTETSYEDDEEIVVVTKQDIIDLLGNNPTECWEFLENDSMMGRFQEADFDKIDPKSNEGELYWMTTWEARFPDEDGLNAAFAAGVKPYYLMNTAKWIVSTNVDQATNETLSTPMYGFSVDSAEYRLAKFRNELHNYFDVNYLCSYYMITECLAAADQRVKNMMWGYWYNPDVESHEVMGKMRCYPIFYDNDTILGLDNTGKIALNWDADENTMNGASYAFAGHDSTIWVNLRSQFSDYLQSAYLRLRNENMTNDTMLRWYNTNQSDMYGERIYNKDSVWKYVVPTNIGVPVLENGVVKTMKYSTLPQMQGSRRAHRSWFINNRMDLFDAKYQGGSYKALNAEITWKGAVNIESDDYVSLKAKTSRNYYLSLYEASSQRFHQLLTPETELDYQSEYGVDLSIGAVFHLYGIKWLKELDLSNWGGYEYLTFGSMPTLETLILGGHRGSAPAIAPIVLGTSTPSLKYLDITNIAVTSIDLTGCIYLEDLIASGSKLASVDLASGCNIKRMVLPETFTNLSLIGLPNLTIDGIQLANSDNLLRLRVEGCNNLDGIALLNSLLSIGTSSLRFVRITDINMSGNGDELLNYMNLGLGGVDSSGNTVANKCKLIGTYKLTKLLDETTYNNLCTYFDELNIQQPVYTEIQFDLKETTPEKISNLDNQTGKLFGNEYTPSGYILNILNKRHSYLVKNTSEAGVVAAMRLDDSNSNIYSDGTSAALDGSEGDYCGYEPHYWYKGVNDHKNRTIHAFFSDKEEVPTKHEGLKVYATDCEVKKGYIVSTSNSYTKDYNAIIVGTSNAYTYTLPEIHNYKQFRVNGIVGDTQGAIVSDSEGNILLRLSADQTKGMFEYSYLFDTLPDNAKFIHFTTNNVGNYCLYLTESEDVEAIEPDWVEHQEEFIGKLLSVPYNGSVRSILALTANDKKYPTEGNGATIVSNCALINNAGYYPFDYEAFKNIILLAYAKYGTTAMHSDVVGAGCLADGTNSFNGGKYFPNGIDYTMWGLEDTMSDGMYDSYYYKDSEIKYPLTATLMGYHQFVCQGSVCSSKDTIKRSNYPVYTNTRTNRSINIYSSTSDRNIAFIQGGRYLDLFGVQYTNATSTTGFCGAEKYTSGTNSAGYLSLGLTNTTDTKYSIYFEFSNGTPTTSISGWSLSKVQRLLIVPTKINFYNNSSEFKAL